jgi:predicted MFS family arabinose efflux permease
VDQLSPTASAVQIGGVRPYWCLMLLFAGIALNLFDRQIINILAQDIKREFVISDAQLGLLTGTAFAFFYSIVGIPVGLLADRVNRIKLVASAISVWSLFTIFSGFTANFFQLVIARMGVGIGEAGSAPASTALISDLFPDKGRATAMSVLLLGAPVGSFIGLGLGGYVAAEWGWRAAFIVAGVPGLVLAPIMLATMRDPRHQALSSNTSTSVAKTVGTLFQSAAFRWLALGMVCSSFMVYGSGAWLPPFFIRNYGMTLTEIGSYSAIAVGIGGGLGTLGGGFICDRLRNKVRHVELSFVMLAMVLGIPSMLLTIFGPDRSTAIVGMILFCMCAFSCTAPIISFIQRQTPPESRALAIAFCSAGSNIVPLGLGLPLIGLLSDGLHVAYGQMALGYALLSGIFLAVVAGVGALWRARTIITNVRL